MKKSTKKLGSTDDLKQLHKALLLLRTPDEARKFLRDLCTITEIRAMSERWIAAQMIAKGVPYREIAKKTGISTSTITRVGHWLKDGEGGYELVLKRISKK
ncbi:MAG: hypothetical protein ACD_65C00196G0002 [uncultured bacterium]|nr:MAG: hypothetical protein ACD_65C00196G0002 [uncultured bacterium]KKT02572.1 MAG: trp operon repressor [Candidatus Peregrinibacteria bacterium GW2011_GWF2_43_17]KKT20568.1 MAG: Trp operon repressor [Candidatus Peregrinibacteria bacterium GW2011_GWA2_43_8]